MKFFANQVYEYNRQRTEQHGQKPKGNGPYPKQPNPKVHDNKK